jgi:hypothetical protein
MQSLPLSSLHGVHSHPTMNSGVKLMCGKYDHFMVGMFDDFTYVVQGNTVDDTLFMLSTLNINRTAMKQEREGIGLTSSPSPVPIN